MEPSQPDAGAMPARILDTAENLLRRHGLDKLNVVDVARVMKMSHGNVYRHIPSKAALRAAVIGCWLSRVSDQTAAVVRRDGPADQRLVDWVMTLVSIKQRKVMEDAELLAAAAKIVRDAPEVQRDHVALLRAQLATILEAGSADGTLSGISDPQAMAKAILNATSRYHRPDMIANAGPVATQMEELEDILFLIMAGLRLTRVPDPRPESNKPTVYPR
jgi:AcrR family transcriptional regulator